MNENDPRDGLNEAARESGPAGPQDTVLPFGTPSSVPGPVVGQAVEARPATGGLRVLETRVYRGPNIWGYRPMVLAKIDLGRLERYPTSELRDFTDRLLALVPSLESHTCSYGVPGGLVRRMREGTWLGHVMEHLAIELQCLAGTHVTYGKTRGSGEPEGVYNVVYSYLDERIGMLAGWLALRTIDSLLPVDLAGVADLDRLVPEDMDPLAEEGTPFNFQAELEELIRLANRIALGPTTQSLVDEARKRGIPAIRLDDESLVQLGYGRYQKRVRASVTSQTSNIGVETAGDKELTRQLLADAGLPVPHGALVRSPEAAVRAAERLGYPVVVKPLDGNHGRGVSINLLGPDAVRWGYEQAAAESDAVLVEQFLQGRDFRVLVVNGKVIACAERVPANVVGDGQHSIAQLIERVNADPRRGVGHEKVLTRITVDAQVERLLGCSGRSLGSVPAAGEVVFLRSTANMSTGGTAIDRTDVMHPDNREIAARAAQVIGLDVAGMDIVMPDITRSLREVGGGIVEVNAGPGFRMHLQPSEGTPRDVAGPVIDSLFPPGSPCRIPVIAITGTNGKTTTSRMVSRILKQDGKRVGLTTSTGIYIDGKMYLEGDTTGPKSANVVLRDPTVDAAVLETARGGILREGLGFDRCDVGAVLNVQADHLGLRGVTTLEDLAYVKSLVVEVVKDDGYSVLNADDPLTYRMRDKAEGKIVFFSMHGGESSPERLRQHIAAGGKAVVRQPGLRGDLIAIYDGEQYLPLMWTHDIPATLSGAARANVENALAATAITYALGIPIETIKAGLASFSTSFEESPGRMNVFDAHPFKVIVDYAHNPAGMTLMKDLVARIRGEHARVIAVLGGTGDRRDQDIRELGRIVSDFADELVVKEDDDLRGRQPGESAALLREGAIAGGMRQESVSVILEEGEAVRTALSGARTRDLVLVFAHDIDKCWHLVTSFQPDGLPADGRDGPPGAWTSSD